MANSFVKNPKTRLAHEFSGKIRGQGAKIRGQGAFWDFGIWPADLDAAAKRAKEIEHNFTFLTVTNKGAKAINMACLRRDFPGEASRLEQGGGVPAEIDEVVLSPDMRMRLTHNVDKDRGFVNGAAGTIRSVLRKDVFILQSDQNLPILAHPITYKGRKYLPVSYGWATTMRRAQGATLGKIALWFDRRLADAGYAYVGLSRAKRAGDVFLVDRIRRTDWRAVNAANEHVQPSHLSDTDTDEDDRSADADEDADTDEDDRSADTDGDEDDRSAEDELTDETMPSTSDFSFDCSF